MRLLPILIFVGLVFPGGTHAAENKVFLESDGIVAIEAESTDSRLGQWKKKTDVKDYKGSGHLEFTGNRPESGPPKSPLKFRFKISQSGKYQLTLRARKRLISEREDICNDCYVALKGEFTSATSATKSVLRSDTKMFGGKPDGWGWTTLLDVDHQKHPAIYLLKAGETYELTISGRSKNFNIDRILFVHEEVGLTKGQQANPQESKVEAGDPGTGGAARVKRTLTNRQGVEIEAELMELRDDVLICIVDGRRYEIKTIFLSEDDRKFLKEWHDEQ